VAQAASVVTGLFAGFLNDPAKGIVQAVATLASDTGVSAPAISGSQIRNQNVSAAISEKALAVIYPTVQVYSDQVRNLLTEKFRTFSGKIRTVAEVRVSQDRIEGIEDSLRLYVDAVTQVLDSNRGSWGQGAFFAGGYQVNFDAVTQGGRNFLQVAKVTFEVDLSS
jgi:hypothetical protein